MDWKLIRQDWTAFVPAILQRWPDADEEDLLQLDGERETLAAYLAGRTGQDYTLVLDDVAEWQMGEEPADIHMDETRDNVNIRESIRHVPPGEDASDDDRAFGDDNSAEPPVGRD